MPDRSDSAPNASRLRAFQLRVPKIDHVELEELLGCIDPPSYCSTSAAVPEHSDLEDRVTEHIEPKLESRGSVLGIDVYRYSQLEHVPQSLIRTCSDASTTTPTALGARVPHTERI